MARRDLLKCVILKLETLDFCKVTVGFLIRKYKLASRESDTIAVSPIYRFWRRNTG